MQSDIRHFPIKFATCQVKWELFWYIMSGQIKRIAMILHAVNVRPFLQMTNQTRHSLTFCKTVWKVIISFIVLSALSYFKSCIRHYAWPTPHLCMFTLSGHGSIFPQYHNYQSEYQATAASFNVSRTGNRLYKLYWPWQLIDWKTGHGESACGK